MQKKYSSPKVAAIFFFCLSTLLLSKAYSVETLPEFIAENNLKGPFTGSILLHRNGEARQRIIYRTGDRDIYFSFDADGFHQRFNERRQVVEIEFNINKAGQIEVLNERKVDEIHVRTVRYSVTHYMTHAFYRYFPEYHEDHDTVMEGADPFEGPTTKGSPTYSKMLDPEISLREYFKSGGYDLSHPNSGVFFDGEKLVFMSTQKDVAIFDKRLASLNERHNQASEETPQARLLLTF